MRCGDGTDAADRREAMTGRRTIPFSLNKRNLKKIKTKAVAVPPAVVFELPEKVLQFGTGALLRGLPAWCIDKANRQGIFNGRIVAVTAGEEPDPLMRQDGLYTICERSANTKELTASFSINAAISRVLNENLHWDQVLRCVANPEMQIVIAQTHASDLVLKKDNVHWQPPKSFPGKLLAFLYHRFKHFNGEASSSSWRTRTDWKQLSWTGWKLAIIFAIQWQTGWCSLHSHCSNSRNWKKLQGIKMSCW
jgi:tagaturonate reductase